MTITTQTWADILTATAHTDAVAAPSVQHLGTDTRSLVHAPDTLFFALKTDKRNGHDYLEQAYAQGVRQFVVSEAAWLTRWPDALVFQVPDTQMALHRVARYTRERFHGKVVGITGSNGKTIVKEWLFQCLSQTQRVVRSPRSYNSQIGVPLSLWLLRDKADVALIEAGISQTGEMAALEAMIRPQIGILTHLGSAHDQGFKSLRVKLDEKMRLFDHANTLVGCIDDPLMEQALILWQSKNKARRKLVTWSAHDKSADVFVVERLLLTPGSAHGQISSTALRLHIRTLKHGTTELEVTVPFIDDASVHNALTVCTALLALGTPLKQIAASLQALEPIEMRLEMKAASHGCTLLNDSYSNDLHALRIAMDAAQQARKAQPLSLILSDLLQTGVAPAQLYKEVADLIASKQFGKVVGIGEQVQHLKPYLPASMQQWYYPDTASFMAALDQTVFFQNELILLKGARPFAFERIAHRLQQKNHHAVLEVNLAAMTHNLNVYRRALQPGVKLMAMVKAAGYGSGEAETARLLEHHGVDYLGVAYADEGISLRRSGVTVPIMVLNPAPDEFDAMYRFQLEPEIYSLEIMEALSGYVTAARPMRIHLKVDTGMHRLGFEIEDMEALCAVLSVQKHIEVATVFSHLSASDKESFDAFTHSQAAQFEAMYAQITAALGYRPMRHLVNSSGIGRFPQYQYEMVRLGIGLYGSEGTGLQEPLQVVHTLKARISQVREVPAGETIGYNRNGSVNTPSRIATVNIGYADGLLRAAGNGRYAFMVRGALATTIGNICMDMCMIDVTAIPDAQTGDEVIVFGDRPRVEDLAAAMQTISYEVFTGISTRVKRVYWME